MFINYPTIFQDHGIGPFYNTQVHMNRANTIQCTPHFWSVSMLAKADHLLAQTLLIVRKNVLSHNLDLYWDLEFMEIN